MRILSYFAGIIKLQKTNKCLFFMDGREMKVKKLLRFYFTAERAERLLDDLIISKAVRAEFARGAQDCAEEVAALVKKKADMCAFYGCLEGVMNTFREGERAVLENYALRAGGRDGESHRLAVAFARRLKGKITLYDEGLAAAMEYGMF